MSLTLSSLLEAIGLLSASSDTVERFVADTGLDTNDGRTAATAHKTIAKALTAATGLGKGAKLVITVTGGPFIEALDLPSHVTLRGVPGARPEIQSPGTTATILVETSSDVHFEHLKITGGRRKTGSSYGGGLAIRYAMRVSVSDCEVSGNEGYRGGGISVISSEDVRISGSMIALNTAGTQATAVAGANISPTGTISFPIGHGHGGGMYIANSQDVHVVGCQISENHAVLFGGGIAVENSDNLGKEPGPIEIRNNDIYCNQTAHGTGVTTLGAPPSPCTRASMASDVVFDELQPSGNNNPVLGDTEIHQLVDALHGGGMESGMGGGIALRRVNANTRIIDNRIGLCKAPALADAGNIARRGGGISCFIGAYPTIAGNEIAYNLVSDDGGGIAIDQFDPCLPPGTAEYLGIRSLTMLTRQWINIDDNNIHHNRATSDGGGIYATGKVQLSIKSPTGKAVLADNRATQNGGGIRVSYATNLYASDVKILRNTADIVPDPNDPAGGGGLAARNAVVTLERCEFIGNRANQFAGGAVFFVSCFEGGFGRLGFVGKERGQFDEIMDRAYGFHTRVLQLIDCTGSDNKATGARGAGGFLYAVRSPESASALNSEVLGGVEPMWIVIEGAATSLGANDSEFDRPPVGTRKRGTVVIELSGLKRRSIPEDRFFVASNIPPLGIPASTLGMAAITGPPIVVMPDADPAHDLTPSLTGSGFTFGPSPAVTSVVPVFAAVNGGTTLTVTGSAFEDGMRVLVGGKAAKQVKPALTSTSVTVKSPPLVAGVVDVDVHLASGPRNAKVGAVRVVPEPTITDVAPPVGPPGTEVTITGTSFVGAPIVEAVSGTATAQAMIVAHPSETELRVKMPPAPARAVTVELRITLESKQHVSKTAAFAYGL